LKDVPDAGSPRLLKLVQVDFPGSKMKGIEITSNRFDHQTGWNTVPDRVPGTGSVGDGEPKPVNVFRDPLVYALLS
jgi:hypothetical protein